MECTVFQDKIITIERHVFKNLNIGFQLVSFDRIEAGIPCHQTLRIVIGYNSLLVNYTVTELQCYTFFSDLLKSISGSGVIIEYH